MVKVHFVNIVYFKLEIDDNKKRKIKPFMKKGGEVGGTLVVASIDGQVVRWLWRLSMVVRSGGSRINLREEGRQKY